MIFSFLAARGQKAIKKSELKAEIKTTVTHSKNKKEEWPRGPYL